MAGVVRLVHVQQERDVVPAALDIAALPVLDALPGAAVRSDEQHVELPVEVGHGGRLLAVVYRLQLDRGHVLGQPDRRDRDRAAGDDQDPDRSQCEEAPQASRRRRLGEGGGGRLMGRPLDMGEQPSSRTNVTRVSQPRKSHAERRAGGSGEQRELPAEEPRVVAGDRESEPGAHAVGARTSVVTKRSNTRPASGSPMPGPWSPMSMCSMSPSSCTRTVTGGATVPGRVGEQIRHHGVQPRRVGAYPKVRGDRELGHVDAGRIDHVGEQVGKRDARAVHARDPGIEAGEFEQVLDQGVQAARSGAHDRSGDRPLLCGRLLVVVEELVDRDHRGERLYAARGRRR